MNSSMAASFVVVALVLNGGESPPVLAEGVAGPEYDAKRAEFERQPYAVDPQTGERFPWQQYELEHVDKTYRAIVRLPTGRSAVVQLDPLLVMQYNHRKIALAGEAAKLAAESRARKVAIEVEPSLPLEIRNYKEVLDEVRAIMARLEERLTAIERRMDIWEREK